MRIVYRGSFATALILSAAFEIQAEKPQEADRSTMEIITVYGKQNHIASQSMLATKSDMSLMETPAPLIVIDEMLIREQGAQELQDLVCDMSVVAQAGQNFGIGDNLVIRGLGANYTYDGMHGGAGLGNTFNPT